MPFSHNKEIKKKLLENAYLQRIYLAQIYHFLSR